MKLRHLVPLIGLALAQPAAAQQVGQVWTYNGPTLGAQWTTPTGGATIPGAANDLLRANGALGFGAGLTPGTGVAAWIASPTSANLAAALTDETGTGAAVFNIGPSLTTPNLGTPSAITLTNATSVPVNQAIGNLPVTNLGSGTNADATHFWRGDGIWAVPAGGGSATPGGTTGAIQYNNAGAFGGAVITGLVKGNGVSTPTAAVASTDYLVPGGALGTPSSGTLTNATGLPISTGVSGLGTGVATFLATPSSANLAAALTDETGTGAAVFATSPTLVTPVLGTPTSITLTNATGLPLTTGVTGVLPVANGGNGLSGMTAGQIPIAATATTVTSSGNLSGDLTTSGSLATTLATVNANVGTFQGITVNGKGLVTAAADQSYLTTGTAASTYLPLSGGTVSGSLTVANTAANTIKIQDTNALSVGVGGLVALQGLNASAAQVAYAGIKGYATNGTAGTESGDLKLEARRGGTLTVGATLESTGRLVTSASATTNAGFNLPAGTAPTSPVDGDTWTTTTGLYSQINGATVGPLLAKSTSTLSIGWIAGAVPATLTVFTATQATTVLDITGTVEVATGGTTTFSLYKTASGTACASGTIQHSGSFNANGTANTNQTLTLVGGAGNVMASGDRICAVASGAGWTSTHLGSGGITVKVSM